MKIKIITRAVLILLCVASPGCASASTTNPESQQEKTKTDPVDEILEQLSKKTRELTSYQGQIEYKFIQPALFEDETLMKGILYYTKDGNQSKFRLNFQTLKQNEEKEQEHKEEYIILEGSALTVPNKQLKGTWLAHIDYELEQAKYYQLTESDDPNKPMDVFELVSKYMPIVGFTKIEDLKKEFEVSLIDQENGQSEDFIQIHLNVKPNSIYKDDYKYIDCRIDATTGLPAEIVAITTEEDIYEIKFLKPKINEAIDKKVFDFKVPKGFGEPEIILLDKKTNNNI